MGYACREHVTCTRVAWHRLEVLVSLELGIQSEYDVQRLHRRLVAVCERGATSGDRSRVLLGEGGALA